MFLRTYSSSELTGTAFSELWKLSVHNLLPQTNSERTRADTRLLPGWIESMTYILSWSLVIRQSRNEVLSNPYWYQKHEEQPHAQPGFELDDHNLRGINDTIIAQRWCDHPSSCYSSHKRCSVPCGIHNIPFVVGKLATAFTTLAKSVLVLVRFIPDFTVQHQHFMTTRVRLDRRTGSATTTIVVNLHRQQLATDLGRTMLEKYCVEKG